MPSAQLFAQSAAADSPAPAKKTLFERIIGKKEPIVPAEAPTQKALSDTGLYETLAGLQGPVAPFSHGAYTIFVYYDAAKDSRVMASFANEQYSRLHPFVRLQSNASVMVYALPKKTEAQTIHYRLVVNGMWTRDEQNPFSTVDANGVRVSIANAKPLPAVNSPSVDYDGTTKTARFYLYLNTEQSSIVYDTSLTGIDTASIAHGPVYLVGDFTGWDPFLVRMQQSDSDAHLYYADVTLGKGNYYYYFQAGNYDVLDPKNRSIAARRTDNLFVNTLAIETTVDPETGRVYLMARTNMDAPAGRTQTARQQNGRLNLWQIFGRQN